MNTSEYISEANRQLQNSDCFKVLQSDPIFDFQQEISKLLKSRGPSEGLADDVIMTSVFYPPLILRPFIFIFYVKSLTKETLVVLLY